MYIVDEHFAANIDDAFRYITMLIEYMFFFCETNAEFCNNMKITLLPDADTCDKNIFVHNQNYHKV